MWSRATFTIENTREGSSIISQIVALSLVEFKVLRCDRHYPRCFTGLSLQAEISNSIYYNVYLKVKQVCLESIYRGHDVVSVLLEIWKVSHISTVDVEQRNFIP